MVVNNLLYSNKLLLQLKRRRVQALRMRKKTIVMKAMIRKSTVQVVEIKLEKDPGTLRQTRSSTLSMAIILMELTSWSRSKGSRLN